MEYGQGKFVRLREVKVEDAKFILSLRCDPHKARFLNTTENNLAKQTNYIKDYFNKKNEYYFIVENLIGIKIGTFRIYDIRHDSFGIGSWLMVDGVASHEAMEADFLVRQFGFETLGFEKCHFDVRKNNLKVLNYHKLMGAKQIAENELDYFFECHKTDYYKQAKNILD